MPGLLAPCIVKAHGRFAVLAVRPFTGLGSLGIALPRGGLPPLRWPLLVLMSQIGIAFNLLKIWFLLMDRQTKEYLSS